MELNTLSEFQTESAGPTLTAKSFMMACGLAVCLLAQPMIAGQFEDATAAHNRGDYATALHLIRPLADQGNAEAQNNLGFMYDIGQGVPQDYVQAHKWYNLSAANNLDKTNREQAASNRDLMARKMTPAQVAEAQKLAREWKPTSSISFK